jgi:hypothetical protein
MPITFITAFTMFACTRGFDHCAERENVSLKRNPFRSLMISDRTPPGRGAGRPKFARAIGAILGSCMTCNPVNGG